MFPTGGICSFERKLTNFLKRDKAPRCYKNMRGCIPDINTFFFYSLFYVDTNFLFANLQIVL